MKLILNRLSVRLAAALLLSIAGLQAAGENTTRIKLTDPAKPATVRVRILRGDVTVRGTDTQEIVVNSDIPSATSKPRKDGMRVLSSSSGFGLFEQDNVVTLDATEGGERGGRFVLTVPRAATVELSNEFGGDVTCSNVSGNLDIRSPHGNIKLEGIGGAALVETKNGEIDATVADLHESKPLLFSSTNGEVVLRLPENAKANVRLRTHNGTILTNFDENALVTKAEMMRSSGGPSKSTRFGRHDHDMEEVREAVREAVRMGAEAVREAAQIAREAAEAAREGAQIAQEEVEAERTGKPVAPKPPKAPKAPKPPSIAFPSLSGSKLVTGTLNGGGPEITVATMNGDVTLRKLEKK